MQTLDMFFFIVLPYAALIVLLIGTIYRYRATKFKYSSLSTQFLEGRKLFWGSQLFHWGIIILFIGHLVGFLLPDTVMAWNSNPARLVILEVTAFVFGLTSFIGIAALFIRRITNPKIRVVTNSMDIIVELLLLAQIFLGLWTAFGFRWGSAWFSTVLSPYLTSIFSLNPNINAVSALPLVVKFHIIGAFLIFALIPFSRLVHMLVLPLHYLWRPYQLVIWYWKRKDLRDPATTWTFTKSKNN